MCEIRQKLEAAAATEAKRLLDRVPQGMPLSYRSIYLMLEVAFSSGAIFGAADAVERMTTALARRPAAGGN